MRVLAAVLTCNLIASTALAGHLTSQCAREASKGATDLYFKLAEPDQTKCLIIGHDPEWVSAYLGEAYRSLKTANVEQRFYEKGVLLVGTDMVYQHAIVTFVDGKVISATFSGRPKSR